MSKFKCQGTDIFDYSSVNFRSLDSFFYLDTSLKSRGAAALGE